MTLSFKSKKADFVEIMIVVIILFIVAMIWIISFIPLKEIKSDFDADEDIKQEAKDIVDESNETYPKAMDAAFIFILFGLTAGMVVSAFFTQSHAVFFVIAVLLNVAFLIAAGILSNTYIEISEEDDIVDVIPQFPKMHLIMENWPWVILIQGFLVAISLYGSNRFG